MSLRTDHQKKVYFDKSLLYSFIFIFLLYIQYNTKHKGLWKTKVKCLVHSKLCLETVTVFANNLFNMGSLCHFNSQEL